MKDILRRSIPILKFLVPLAILPWLFTQLDKEQLELLRNQPKNYALLVYAIGFCFLGFCFGHVRWMLLVRRGRIPVTLSEAVRLGFMGHLFSLISPGSVGGDLFKAVAVARHRKHSGAEALASVLVDRVMGLYGLIVLMTISLIAFSDESITPTLAWIRRIGLIATLVGAVALTLAVIGGKWLDAIESLAQRIPVVGHSLRRMIQACRLFEGQPSLVLKAVGLTLMVHTCLAICVYLVSTGFYREAPTFVQHLQIVPPALAVGAMPVAPAGLGVQEFAFTELFKQLPNVPSNFSGVAIAVAFRITTLVVVGIGVLYYWCTKGQTAVDTSEAAAPKVVS